MPLYNNNNKKKIIITRVIRRMLGAPKSQRVPTLSHFHGHKKRIRRGSHGGGWRLPLLLLLLLVLVFVLQLLLLLLLLLVLVIGRRFSYSCNPHRRRRRSTSRGSFFLCAPTIHYPGRQNNEPAAASCSHGRACFAAIVGDKGKRLSASDKSAADR